MAAKPGATRRKHSANLEVEVIAECRQAGASVAAIALAQGLNANLVHHWLRRQAAMAGIERAPQFDPLTSGEFMPLRLAELPMPTPTPAVAAAVQPDIRIELRRGANTINVAWSTEAARDCGAWLVELLR